MYGLVFQMLGVLVVLGAIIFLSYVTTRYIGGKAKKATKGHYMKIVDSISMGLDKSIHLIKVGEQFVLVATAGKSIEYLTTVNVDGYEEEAAAAMENPGAFGFKAIFEKYLNNVRNKQDKDAQSMGRMEPTREGERHAFRDNLDRLRNITRSQEQGRKNGDADTYEKE